MFDLMNNTQLTANLLEVGKRYYMKSVNDHGFVEVICEEMIVVDRGFYGQPIYLIARASDGEKFMITRLRKDHFEDAKGRRVGFVEYAEVVS
jgi:hypothetical protein